MAQMSARGCGLRSVAPCSIPSMRMSEAYSNSPLTLGTPSARKVVIPTSLGRWISRRSRTGVSGMTVTPPPPRARAAAGSGARCRRAISSTSAVRSSALSTIGAPADEQQVHRARRAEDERRDGVLDPGVVEAVQAPQRDVGQLADLQRAELVVAAQAARALDGGQRQRAARGHRGRAAGQARVEQRLAQLDGQRARLVGRGAVDPEADGRAGAREVDHGRDARAQARVGARAVRHAGARRAEARDLLGAQVHAVREPHVVAQPAEVLEVLHGAHAEALDGRRPPRRASRPGGCAGARRGAARAARSRPSARA